MINIDTLSLNKNVSYNYNFPQNYQSIETKITNFFSPYTNIVQIPDKISINEHALKNVYPKINYQAINKKTLVLDIDETIVHSSMLPFPNGSHLEIEIKVSGKKYIAYVLKRPYLEQFLNEMSLLFEIIVFTASIAEYAEPLLQELDPNKIIKYKLNRKHCLFYQGNYIKDLKVIKRPIKDLIIIDNTPIAYALNQENGIPIISWYDNPNDIELLKLIPLLKYLAKVNDVRPIIKQVVNKKLNQLDFNIVDKIIKNKNENKTISINLNNEIINNNINTNIQNNLFSSVNTNNNINTVKYMSFLPYKNDYNNINQINNNTIYTKQEITINNINNNKTINSNMNNNKMNDKNIFISNNGNINSNNQIAKSINNSIYNMNNNFYDTIFKNNISHNMSDININKSVVNINNFNNNHNIINETKSNIINNVVSKNSTDIKGKSADVKNNFNKKNDTNLNINNNLDKKNIIKIDNTNKVNNNYINVNKENKNINLIKDQAVTNTIFINKNNNKTGRYVLNPNYEINSEFNVKSKNTKIITKKLISSNSTDNLNNSKPDFNFLKNNVSSINIINPNYNIKNKDNNVENTENFDSLLNNTSYKNKKDIINKNILNTEDKNIQLPFNKNKFKKAKVVKLNDDIVFNKLTLNNFGEKSNNTNEIKNSYSITEINPKIKKLESKNYLKINSYIPDSDYNTQINSKMTNFDNNKKNIKKVKKLKINDKTKKINENYENDDTNNFVKIKRIDVKKIQSSKSPKNKGVKVRKINDKENEKINKKNNISESPFNRDKYLRNNFKISQN